MRVRKAVIPAAGMGTRMLPASRTVPKELLPVVDRPIIHYAVEEAIAAGITQVIIITAAGKEALAEYFTPSSRLEAHFNARGETELLSTLRRLWNGAQFTYVVQKEQLGLGHAVLMARDAVGDEPFAVLLPDDILVGGPPALGRVLEVARQYEASVVAVEEVPPSRVSAYGIVRPRPLADGLFRVLGLVEKPLPQEAPSNLGIVGRYVLTPQIFAALERIAPGARGELQLTDALALLLKEQPVFACRLPGTRYDAGFPLGLLQTSVALALQREDVGPALREWLKGILKEG
jgi:UTP--glucose-1-phosphate uridylyltransferase